MDRSLRQSQTSRTWAQLYLTRVQSLRYSLGLHIRQQHWQGWNQFGMTVAFLSVPRFDWCAHLSHPSSCMFVNHGPSQQSSKLEYKPKKWGATARSTHLIQRPCYKRGSPCRDQGGNRTTRRLADHCKEMHIVVASSCLSFIRSDQNHLARHSEGWKKTRQTEEEVGRQHQGMDRHGVRQVQDGSGEQGKWRKLVVKSSVVPQRPSRLRDRWWWWWSWW